MMTVFYWIYAVALPIACCGGYIVVCLVSWFDRFTIKGVALRMLWWLNASCNGLDALIVSVIVVSSVLPALWNMVIADIYGDFCAELSIIGDGPLCDTLVLEVSLQNGVWIAGILVLSILSSHCLLTINCSQCCLKRSENGIKDRHLDFVALTEPSTSAREI